MSGRTVGSGLLSLAVTLVFGLNVGVADVTPIQSVSIPNDTQTNWSSTTPSLQGTNPCTFNQFDPHLGTLQSVNVTMSYTITQSVSISASTAATLHVTSGFQSSPNGAEQGTTIALTLPTGGTSTTLVEAQAPVLTYTKTFGPDSTSQTYSTDLPPSSPYYLKPDGQSSNVFTGTVTKTITDPTLLALFQGSGTIGLPMSATAGSSITNTNGNYGSRILTFAGATIQISYTYAPNTPVIPEPSSVVLMGMGGGVLFLAKRLRRGRLDS